MLGLVLTRLQSMLYEYNVHVLIYSKNSKVVLNLTIKIFVVANYRSCSMTKYVRCICTSIVAPLHLEFLIIKLKIIKTNFACP